MTIKFFFILVVFIILNIFVRAQSPYGHALTAYGALDAVDINPANVVSTPYNIYVSVGALNFTFNNNIASFVEGLKIYNDINNYQSNRAKMNYLANTEPAKRIKDGKVYDVYANALIKLPLINFMVSLGKYGGLALSTNTRVIASVANAPLYALTKGLEEQFSVIMETFSPTITNYSADGVVVSFDPKLRANLKMEKMEAIVAVFSEIGLTYAMPVFQKGEHTVKSGVTLKYLIGHNLTGFKSNNFSSNVIVENTNKLSSVNTGRIDLFASHTKLNFNQDRVMGQGFGVSIGGIYEWNPRYNESELSKIEDSYLATPYKLKLGFSITDIGAIKYDALYGVATFNGDTVVNNRATFTKGIELSQSGIDSIKNKLGGEMVQTNSLFASLPTLIHLYADYHIRSFFYVAANFAFRANKLLPTGAHVPLYSHFVVAPRLQTRYFDVGIPLTYIPRYNQLKVGLSLRLWFAYLGSDDLGLLFNRKSAYGTNFYLGVAVALAKNKKKLAKEWKENYIQYLTSTYKDDDSPKQDKPSIKELNLIIDKKR